jgi:hypothetical protein
MKFYFFMMLILSSLFLTGCGRLDMLKWNDMTSEKWLVTHSYVPVSIGPFKFTLAEPSSTVLVYGLGVIILLAGFYVLKNRRTSKSKIAWGIALVMWAFSTFCAGTSYQAFSYELKCAGRTVCLWTSWWEIWYLMLFVISMNVIVVAVAFSSTTGKLRKAAIGYAILNSLAYLVTVLSGAFIPDQFMASFECMVLFAVPTFLILLLINSIRFAKLHRKLDLLLVGAWILMIGSVFAYFGFYVSGYALVLWEKGIWFNENDVLHIALVLWIIYFTFAVSNKIEDAQ